MKRIWMLLFLVVLLSGCGASQEFVQNQRDWLIDHDWIHVSPCDYCSTHCTNACIDNGCLDDCINGIVWGYQKANALDISDAGRKRLSARAEAREILLEDLYGDQSQQNHH